MIRFSKYTLVYILFSAFFLVPGIFSLIRFGMMPSIDFTGGALLEIEAPKEITKQILEQTASKIGVSLVSIQQTSSGSFIFRTKPEASEKSGELIRRVLQDTGATIRVVRNETVGPTLGQELLKKALIAAFIAISGILLYVAYAFKNVTYGVAAITALIHDLLIVLGIFSLLGYVYHVEIDTLFVTAVLTTMSFSVHDTIVVFDRIRELGKRGTKSTFAELADTALTQTMSRSLANSVTIIIMLLALVLLGGESIRWFAVALLIGTISGTYSSPFIATPVLIILKKRLKQ